MQPIIDIIYELSKKYIDAYLATHPAIGPYVDRGDPAVVDFHKGNFIHDGAWHTLDLSSIVPAGAVAIAFNARLASSIVGKAIQLRRHGNVNGIIRSMTATQVANISVWADMFAACDPDRKIDYKVTIDPWTVLELNVKGWWLKSEAVIGFVNRGDPAAHDFTTGDFIKDAAWHELDLTGIIPANTKCIVMRCVILADADGNFVRFRTSGHTHTENVSECRTVFANRIYSYDIEVPVDGLQKIEYYASPADWTALFLAIKGWWY